MIKYSVKSNNFQAINWIKIAKQAKMKMLNGEHSVHLTRPMNLSKQLMDMAILGTLMNLISPNLNKLIKVKNPKFKKTILYQALQNKKKRARIVGKKSVKKSQKMTILEILAILKMLKFKKIIRKTMRISVILKKMKSKMVLETLIKCMNKNQKKL
jgi:hypothetical protein